MSNSNFPNDHWDALKALMREFIEKNSRPANEVILDDVDLREMLKISRRTALSYRQSKKLVYFKIENKIYYFLSDILNFIKTTGKSHD